MHKARGPGAEGRRR
uniref:Uncharacterized protein n=1 Tax=Arundo donax TaxID=35708 RepID=A0A0A9H6L3_ARUDO